MSERRSAPSNQTVDRALDVLFALLAGGPSMALSDIARACDLAPSTTHRLLTSLVARNLVQHETGGGRYRLGLGLLAFSHAILNGLDVREASTAPLNDLAEHTRETIHLAVLDGFDLVYVDRRDTPHAIRLNTSIGRRTTPHTTGVGKALLAFSDDDFVQHYLAVTEFRARTPSSLLTATALLEDLQVTRERGYAIDRQEDQLHVQCIAAPVLGPTGTAVAAISISAPDSRRSLDELEAWAPDLLERTRRIGLALGWRGAPPEGG